MSERKIRPVPKPESTKKSKSKTKGITKTVDTAAVDEKRKAQNNINRNFGKSVERQVAKIVGGERTPMSGAVKNSNRNLTGDVEVKDALGRDFMKLEVKGTSNSTPKGDKTFTLKKSVLDQTFYEAEEAHEIGALYIHWKGGSYEQEDYVILESKHFIRLIELAKLGVLVEEGKHGS